MDFKSGAAELAELLPRSRLHPQALAELDASAQRSERWIIAFSGGADSLTALLSVWAHWPEQRRRIVAAHFNHGLRGSESDGDEAFCHQISDTLGLAFATEGWVERPADVSEERARAARLDFLERTAEAWQARVIVTGHQRDDIVETQLMRLGRGASSAGLAAPRPVRLARHGRVFVRPLLDLGKSDLTEALRRAGCSWREDSTNAGRDFTRNRLRHDVVPAWIHALGRRALEGAALTREWLQEDDEALENWIDRLELWTDGGDLRLERLAGLPPAIWRRVLWRWLGGRELSRAGFAELLALARAGSGQMSLGSGWAVAEAGLLRWREPRSDEIPWQPAHWSLGTELCLPNGARLSARAITVDDTLLQRLCAGEVDNQSEAVVAVQDNEFVVRPRAPGDRYRPLGAPGTAKLQDLLVNRRVKRELRDDLPLICRADGRIIWVPGLSPAEDSKVTAQSVMAAQLTYTAGTSTVDKQS